jgi:hypothetical protein
MGSGGVRRGLGGVAVGLGLDEMEEVRVGCGWAVASVWHMFVSSK